MGGAEAVLRFLWAAIKNAPSSWYNRMVSNAAGRMAAQVQQAVSEGNAAYEVVVRGGVPTDGTRAGPRSAPPPGIWATPSRRRAVR